MGIQFWLIMGIILAIIVTTGIVCMLFQASPTAKRLKGWASGGLVLIIVTGIVGTFVIAVTLIVFFVKNIS